MTGRENFLERLLTVSDVLDVTGYRSRTTLWRKVRAGEFPAPLKDGATSIRWRDSDIQHWIESLPRQTYGGGVP